MSKIFEFFADTTRESVKQQGFTSAIDEGLTASELRELEMQHLRPESVPKPVTKAKDPIEDRTVKIRFGSDEDLAFFKKFIRTHQYQGLNTYDTGIIIDLLRMLDRDGIKYSRSGRYFYYESKNGRVIKAFRRMRNVRKKGGKTGKRRVIQRV